jgi:hypothetical protein
MFHIEVRCEVTHDDREIEYHDLMDLTRGFVAESAESTETCSFGSMSCEQIARRLGIKLSEKYERPFTVLVSEDGEAGAMVRTQKKAAGEDIPGGLVGWS